MVISVQDYLNAGVKTVRVKDENFFWVKMLDVQKKLGVKNMSGSKRHEIISILGVRKRCDKDFKKYKRSLQEITNNMKDNCKDKYVRNDIAEKVIKIRRGVKKCKNGGDKSNKEKHRQNSRTLLGFNEKDIFLTKEQAVVNAITTVFARREIYLQYSVLNYKIDA